MTTKPNAPKIPAMKAQPVGADILKTTLTTSPRDRDRNRIRMEFSLPKAKWLLGKVSEEVKGSDIDSPNFREMYGIYTSLRTQIDSMEGRAKK